MNNICLRIATKKDAQALIDIYKYYVLNTPFTFEYDVPSVEEFEKRIETISEKYPYIVAEKDGTIVGYTYASAFKNRSAYDWSVETSVYVKNELNNLGIGTLLCKKLEEILKEQNIVNLIACITFPNTKSIEFHQKLGYEEVARIKKVGYKFGKWHDVVWLQKNINEYKENPPEIIKSKF